MFLRTVTPPSLNIPVLLLLDFPLSASSSACPAVIPQHNAVIYKVHAADYAVTARSSCKIKIAKKENNKNKQTKKKLHNGRRRKWRGKNFLNFHNSLSKFMIL